MTETWSWIDAAGVAHPMNGFAEGIAVMEGITGRGMPPIRVARDTVAGQPGQRTRDVKHDLRSLMIPIYIEDVGEAELLAQIRNWMRNFDPARGDGALMLTAADSNTRKLICRYASGLELTEDSANRFWEGRPAQLAIVTFEADSPYWLDLDTESLRFSMDVTPPVWFPDDEILPLILGDSFVVGDSTVTVDSDADVWPVWTVTGPGNALLARNNTTGRQFIWNGTLADDTEILTIDTRPGVKSVRREDDTNVFGSLTSRDLWPFAPGDNDLDVTMAGTDDTSGITVSWQNARLTS